MAGKYGRTFKRKSAKKSYNKKTSAKKLVRQDRTKKLVKLIKSVSLGGIQDLDFILFSGTHNRETHLLELICFMM